MHDYQQLGIIAYSLINGAILLSFVTALGLCGYAWWRLLKWALRRQP